MEISQRTSFVQLIYVNKKREKYLALGILDYIFILVTLNCSKNEVTA
jgi:hypothetical protein